MKKILLSLSLLTFIGVQTGCNNNRQLQEEVDSVDTESSKSDSTYNSLHDEPTEMEKGFDGREAGGGGGNR